MRWRLTGVSIVCPTVCSGANQRKHKAPHHWPLWGDSTGDPWISRMDSPENISIWWHHYALCFQPGDRNIFGICSLSKWTVPSVSWQGVDVRNQRWECPKMSDVFHAWNKFGRFYVRYSSCFLLIPVSYNNARNPIKGIGRPSAQYKAYSSWH